MRPKLLCAVSLLLNVALAGYWLKSRGAGAAPSRTTLSSSIGTNRPARGPSRFWSPPPVPTPQVPEPSPWSRIASADYPVFIANLRSTGCPERTIRDIVVPKVKEQFTSAQEVSPVEDRFWLPTAAQEERELSAKLESIRLEGERRTTLKTLLGVEDRWPKMMEESPDDWAGLWALLKLDRFEVAEEFTWGLDRMDWNRRAFLAGIPEPLKLSEIEKLGQIRDEGFGRLTTIAGKEPVENALKLVATLVPLLPLSELKDPAARVPEDELRRIVAVQPVDWGWAGQAFDFELVNRLERFRAGLPKDFIEEARRAFPTTLDQAVEKTRAEELRRLVDPDWEQSARFATDNQLPPAVAISLIDARTLAEAEAKQVRNDPDLQPEEEQTRLRGIAQDLRAALGELMPPAAWDDYQRQHGSWINDLESGRGGETR